MRYRDNSRAPVQFRGERQCQHFKWWYFINNRPLYFHMTSTAIIWMIFPSIKINKPFPTPVKCLSNNSSSSSTPIKSPGDSTKCSCQKICNWTRRPETILEIRKKKQQISWLVSKILLTTDRRLNTIVFKYRNPS